jgi:hypothetical protein
MCTALTCPGQRWAQATSMALESAPPLKATTKGGKWSKACKAWVNG